MGGAWLRREAAAGHAGDHYAPRVATPIFVITGQVAAGKSSLARAVLARFDRGYHVDVDALREMVVSGLAGPLEWTDETSRQFELAIEGSVALARVYFAAGSRSPSRARWTRLRSTGT